MVNQPCISLYVSGGRVVGWGIMDSNTCIVKVYHFWDVNKKAGSTCTLIFYFAIISVILNFLWFFSKIM